MIILDLSILGVAVCLVIYAKQMLEKASAAHESTKVIADKHNQQLSLLKSRVEGLSQVSRRAIDLAKQPCEKCGHRTNVPLL